MPFLLIEVSRLRGQFLKPIIFRLMDIDVVSSTFRPPGIALEDGAGALIPPSASSLLPPGAFSLFCCIFVSRYLKVIVRLSKSVCRCVTSLSLWVSGWFHRPCLWRVRQKNKYPCQKGKPPPPPAQTETKTYKSSFYVFSGSWKPTRLTTPDICTSPLTFSPAGQVSFTWSASIRSSSLHLWPPNAPSSLS